MNAPEGENADNFGELLDAIVEETATAKQWQMINRLLESSADFRRLYVAHLQLIGQLRWNERNHFVDAAPAKLPDSRKTLVQTAVSYVTRPTPFSISVAAMVMGLLITGMAFLAPPFYRAITSNESDVERGESYRIMAEVTGLHDIRWTDEDKSAHDGAFLIANQQLQLDSGLIEVTFRNGARMIVEGPASFQIQGAKAADLAHGKLVAHVPPTALGFTIETDYARVIDTGTEFAVDAQPSGDAEVHVLSGRVEVHRSGSQEGAKPTKLAAGEALRISKRRGQISLAKIDHQGERFARVSPVSEDQWNEESPLPVTHGLSLWLTADYGIVRDASGKVIEWKDRLTGDNRRAEDGIQRQPNRRPTWVADGIGGMPAIEFDGRHTHLVTIPRQVDGQLTMIAVFAVSPKFIPGQRGGQLINTNSRPNFVLEVGAGAIVARCFDGNSDDPVLKFSLGHRESPLMATFLYDHSTNASELQSHDGLRDTGIAADAVSDHGRTHIGSHPEMNGCFHGKIAEILIYNSALSPDDLNEVQRYLTEKYQL